MFRTTRRAVAATVCALAAKALAGCVPTAPVRDAGGSEVPTGEASKVQAGDCLSGNLEIADSIVGADLSTVVECNEPSHYLVYGVFDIPAEFLPPEGASAEEIAIQRGRITLVEGRDFADFQSAARTMCSGEFITQAGLADVYVMGSSAADVVAEPAGNFHLDITASSERQWAAGEHYFVCSLGWENPAMEPVTFELGSGITVADFLTPEWPEELRRCTVWDGDGTENADAECSEQHWMEHSVMIDPWSVQGEDARQAFDVDSADDEQWLELDAYCAPFIPWFTGPEASLDDYWASTVWINWEGDEVPVSVVCGFSVAISDTHDVVGSLVGIGAGTPETIEVLTS